MRTSRREATYEGNPPGMSESIIGRWMAIASRLAQALEISDREGLTRYVAVQEHYNLVHQEEFESELAGLCEHEGLSCLA
jgi:hypothetical protein